MEGCVKYTQVFYRLQLTNFLALYCRIYRAKILIYKNYSILDKIILDKTILDAHLEPSPDPFLLAPTIDRS